MSGEREREPEERYEDCERCGERYVGERAIRAYLRETRHGLRACLRCLRRGDQ